MDKVKKLEKSIIDTHLIDFKFKLSEVISMGESPIEKLMMLQLFNYFQKFDKNDVDDDFSKFYNLDFIEEEICLFNFPDDPEPMSNNKLRILEDKVQRFNYRCKNGMYYKYIGFKCTLNSFEPNSMNSRDIEIRPQYYQFFNDDYNRIDIALILKRRDWFKNDEVIEERRIAIECDGYDYHSSPQQKMDDDIRSRKLKRAGWKDVLRYSGSEIHRINDNLDYINYNFEEIIDIIMM